MAKKIYINPGHSDRDPGAVGYEQERRLTVAVSNHMRDYLLANYDCEIKMNPGTMGDLYTVCKEANAWGADLFVSNHFNAGKGDGYEVWVYSEARRALGKIFEKHVLAIGQNSRGVKLQPGFIVLRDTNMPAVLNEGAFVDNLKDIQDWNDDAELKAMGIAYAKAAAEYLGLAKKATQPTTTTTTPPAEKTETGYQLTLHSLSKGCTGDEVRALQALLKGYGYDCGKVDGIFGSNTDAQVRAYQKDHGLTVDGVAGPATMGSMLGV